MTDTLGTSNLKAFLKFDGRIVCRLWTKKARAVFNLSKRDIFHVLQGSNEPEDTAAKI